MPLAPGLEVADAAFLQQPERLAPRSTGMTLIQAISALLVFTAGLLYVNHRWVGLPATVGVMLLSSLFSLCVLASHHLGFDTARYAEDVVRQVDFNELLLDGVLSFLLFAGAFHIDLSELLKSKWLVATLATFGVLASTLLVGWGLWAGLGPFGIGLPLAFCFLFGALVSPTDPISVLSILRDVEVPKPVETQIAAESLFNDGVGVVAFIVVSSIAFAGIGGPTGLDPGTVLLLFLREVGGGALLGGAIGLLGCRMLAKVDDHELEILLTLALVMGGYSLAGAIEVSSPIAVVVAGLIVGHGGRAFTIGEPTRQRLHVFWALLDKGLNAVLFVLIGLEFLLIPFSAAAIAAGLFAIALVLCVRLVGVGIPVLLLGRASTLGPHAIKIMTWGGLRGGISIALALSLPPGPERDAILSITYIVVLFSILVQGLTMRRLIAWTKGR